MSTQTFMAYWLGYQAGGPALQDTPTSVGVVALAFAVNGDGPNGNTITTGFLTKEHSQAEMQAGAKALQQQGVKVLMSINGKPNWEGHPGGWDNLDPDVYAANVKQIVVDEWGLDGVDLDNEDGSITPGANFVAVIAALRKALGPDALITIPVYMGTERDAYLAQAKDDLSFVSTMAYWNDAAGQEAMFTAYAGLVGPEKVAIGVADAANAGQNTDFAIVPQLAAWNPTGASKAGIMLWNLNAPAPAETATWCAAIANSLP